MIDVPREWSFDAPGVAQGFGAHVREQLPWYDLVTAAVAHIARHYVPQGGLVVDVGASDGNVGRALAPLLADRHATLVPVDPSPAMLARYDGPGQPVQSTAEAFAFPAYDLAVCMLSLMFVPVADLPDLLARMTARIRHGGALLVVERTLPPQGYPSVVTSRLTLAAKAAAGASADSIVAKELSLAGVQRPIDPELLAPYGAVPWFRYGDFAGYLIESQGRPSGAGDWLERQPRSPSGVCIECGNDDAAEGYAFCTDCLEGLSDNEGAE